MSDSKELRVLYSSPSIACVVISISLQWVQQAVQIWEAKICLQRFGIKMSCKAIYRDFCLSLYMSTPDSIFWSVYTLVSINYILYIFKKTALHPDRRIYRRLHTRRSIYRSVYTHPHARTLTHIHTLASPLLSFHSCNCDTFFGW